LKGHDLNKSELSFYAATTKNDYRGKAKVISPSDFIKNVVDKDLADTIKKALQK
jgi:hypothetical protein